MAISLISPPPSGLQPEIKVNGILKGDGNGSISAADVTEVELVSLPNICNPNLLDNWYFGNPVNQRDGKIIQQGVNIYIDSTLETLIGPAAYACPVVELTSTYAKVQDTKNTSQYYYAAPGNVVPGYTGIGYTIDRWKFHAWNTNSAAVRVVTDGVRIVGTSDSPNSCKLLECVQLPIPAGTVVTASILISAIAENVKSPALWLCKSNGDVIADVNVSSVGLYTFTTVIPADIGDSVSIQWGQDGSRGGYGNTDMTVKAVKLELGSQQTLAHQENGVWVLNEIPDYGEQLRRCQRYYFKTASAQYSAYLMHTNTGDFLMDACIFPVTMRTVPSIQLLSYRSPTTGAVITAEGDASQITPDGFCIVNDAGKFAGSSVFQVAFSATADL